VGARTGGKGIRRPPGEPSRKVPVGTGEEAHLRWNRRNYLILGSGGVAIILGFIILAMGDKTIAPILLVGGYLGLIPWGIMAGSGRGDANKRSNTPGE